MYITGLKLKNIGPYVGDVEFDFTTNGNKNITLVGGMNGSGKTTLLNAIKLALFGSFSLGFKSDTSAYRASVIRLLNYRVLETLNPHFMLEVSFILDEEYSQNNYQIRREWTMANSSSGIYQLEEKHRSLLNGNRLSDESEEDLYSKLKEIYSPKMIEMSFFDGEKIGTMIDESQVPNYIRDLFYTNFGINYFDKLTEDLEYYHTNEIAKGEKTVLQLRFEEYEQDYKRLTVEKSELTKSIREIESNVRQLEIELKNEKRKYTNYGGLTNAEKAKIAKKANEDFAKLKIERDKIQNLFETNFFYVMHKKILLEVVSSSRNEMPVQHLKNLKALKEFYQSNNQKTPKEIDELILKLKGLIKDKVVILHDFDQDLEKRIYSKLEDINHIDIEGIKAVLEDFFEERSKNQQDLRNLEKNEVSLGLISVLNNINSIEQDLSQRRVILNAKNDTLISIQKRIDNYLIEIDKINAEIRKSSNSSNSFNTAISTIQAINEFVSAYQTKITTKVADLTLSKFGELSPKTDYVKSLKIADDFEISLIDNEDKIMPIDILSAGEKQLLIASLIFAVTKLSNRKTLFVFDTPLARLDKKNRNRFAEKIIRDISDQVLVLSTNSEIVGKTKRIIEDRISREYLLDYQDRLNETRVLHGYFGGKANE
jgi:DNA sulfur modification protein DndD